MADPNQNLSSEIYLGYSTARSPLGNIESFQPDESVDYKFDPNKTSLEPNIVYFDGIGRTIKTIRN
jgi:hypothetical protein